MLMACVSDKLAFFHIEKTPFVAALAGGPNQVTAHLSFWTGTILMNSLLPFSESCLNSSIIRK